MPKSPDVITRFAPSPTGHLHIGGARSALFCWAFAKRNGGRFVLRIEDTDQARSSDESARGIMEDLAWLGIDWDDGPELVFDSAPMGGGHRTIGGDARGVGPFFQARRGALYNSHLLRLIADGKAYPAFENEADLDAKRKAAVAAKQTYRYDRAAARDIPTPAQRLARMKDADAKGEKYVVRLLAPHEEIVVRDLVLGDVKTAPGELDDFVIRKADGFPTYHFAVVVDDETMGVTHVMRAQEHLSNTPRHVALQRALGFRTPAYAHMPLIFNMDSSKMSKRDKAKAARKAAKDAIAKGAGVTSGTIAAATGIAPAQINQFLAAENDSTDLAEAVGRHFGITLPEVEIWDFRRSGYLPEAIINFIGLLGWNPGMKLPDGKDLEKFDRAFIAEHFSLERVGRTNARFDRAKLLSFNADAIAALSDDEFSRRWLAWAKEHEPTAHAELSKLPPHRLLILARTIKPRAKTLRDGLKSAAFILTPDDAIVHDPAAVQKHLLGDDRRGLKLLATVRERLGSLSEGEWNPALIHSIIEQVGQQSGAGMGPVSQSVRVAVTGTGVSPGLGETLAVLGKASTLARIDRCLSNADRAASS